MSLTIKMRKKQLKFAEHVINKKRLVNISLTGHITVTSIKKRNSELSTTCVCFYEWEIGDKGGLQESTMLYLVRDLDLL